MNKNIDQQKQIEEETRLLNERMARVKHKIVVMSGKGGVGKSTLAANIAWALAYQDKNVGILDVDIHGPNIPKLMGIEKHSFSGSESEIYPVEVLPNLKAASIALSGYDADTAFIWRGPLKAGIIRQFLANVVWDELDYMIIDTPPGTGDESLTVCQILPDIDGAVIVTTPQDLSLLDSRKSVNFAKKLNVKVLGIVENMSGFICPHCGEITNIFGYGGGEAAASELGLSFLGRVPIEPAFVASGDSGTTPLSGEKNSAAVNQLKEIIQRLQDSIELD